MTPDENKQAQKAADTDRGPRAGLQYYPGWSKPLPKPNMQGIEQTYNRPYYAAEGGVTHMAEGGITPLLDQKQLFADYLKRVMGGGGTETGTGTGAGTETETKKPDLPFLEAPIASNTRSSEGGGGGYGSSPEGRAEREARMDELRADLGEEGYAHRNDWIGKTLGTMGKFLMPGGFLMDMFKKPVDMGITPEEADTLQNEEAHSVRDLDGNLVRQINTPAANPLAKDPAQQQQQQQQQQAENYARATEALVGTNIGRVPAGISLNDFTKNYADYGEGRVSGGGGGGGHDWGGGGQGAATGGNNGDASGGGDRGTRGGFAQGGGVHGGLSNPYNLGSYSDGGRLLKGPGDGVSDSIPATIGKGRPARLADGEFVIPARIVSEIGNGSTEAGARKLYAMMDRIQAGRKKSVGKGKVAVNSRADKYLPA
jgi:hypothetical protein